MFRVPSLFSRLPRVHFQRSSSLLRSFILLLTAATCLAVSCRERDTPLKDDVAYFRKYLEPDMNYDDLVKEFGEPAKDINAEWSSQDGLHIYEYPLWDSTSVRIGYRERIVYAVIVDERMNLLEDIIEVQTNDD